ncbi:DNA mismatch repair endonuclease MutL [Diplocloster modestus]|uniref:DNA mismatch repair protein MutL n=1 Tax=Diplocloster modestus TaxID=2850322 RepID=A0ABS6KCL4_9FIRM|nr:DNA mismatch repair endonuclease MutL [Diplocloster modestus]MBU9728245.1 DNA mismatch repair endonuclease MutL [Diplocloster modestus]
MGRIEVLDQHTIDKIAAGEVIERPSSVVKELAENAIDAGASSVTVEIKEGGISFIRITDNGSGIEKDQVPTAFLRHSTSKIRAVEDLMTIHSLGFRGEALSSIAAVAQVELVTKTHAEGTGIRYLIEGGKEVSLEEVGAPDGTTFLVRNLFYNTPARKKFLKAAMTEAGYINDLLIKLALSHPDISFKFINNGQVKLHTSGNTNLKDIIYGVYGREIASELIAVEAGDAGVQIRGFIGKPVISRGNRNYENYYINGRYIKSQIISKAIEDAYKTFMMQHKYPFAVLHFTIEGDLLDVNVHPTKMELRFSNQEEIYQLIVRTLKDALSGRELIPEVTLDLRLTRRGGQPDVLVNEATEGKSPFGLEYEAQKKGNPSDSRISLQPEADKKSDPGQKNLEYFMQEMRRRVRANHEAQMETQRLYEQIQPIHKTRNPGEDSGDIASKEFHQNGLYEDNQTENGKPEYQAFIQEESFYGRTDTQGRIDTVGAEAESAAAADGIRTQPDAGVPADYSSGFTKAEQLELFEHRLLDKDSRMDHRIIGQLFETYWLVQFQEHLYIIDQHAAHEKVLYERTMKSLGAREFTSQLLSPPIILTLTMQEAELLKCYQDYFTQIGFEIEPFGGNEYSVRAVPDNLFGIAQKDLLVELIDGLADFHITMEADMINQKIASMSCKAAVKGNQALSEAEAKALIDELLELENPYNCPHGRPTIISMSKYELEKKFKRIV